MFEKKTSYVSMESLSKRCPIYIEVYLTKKCRSSILDNSFLLFWKKNGLVALLVSLARAAIAACQKSDCSIQSREEVLMLARHTHDLCRAMKK